MAQTLTIAPQLITPGALRHSATRTISGKTTGLLIQMTDTGDWFGGVTHGNILIWGYEVSTDGGATWTWKQWQPGRDDPTQFATDGQVMPFGTDNKSHTLPALRLSGSDVLADAGHLARLVIAVDTSITLGATITAN